MDVQAEAGARAAESELLRVVRTHCPLRAPDLCGVVQSRTAGMFSPRIVVQVYALYPASKWRKRAEE